MTLYSQVQENQLHFEMLVRESSPLPSGELLITTGKGLEGREGSHSPSEL